MSRRSRVVRGAAIVVATALVTVALVLVVTVRAYSAGPGEWSMPVRFGLFGIGPTIDASVASLVRTATQPIGIALLDGRAFATRAGTLRFAREGDGLAIDCAPCSLAVPGLGNDRVEVEALHVTAAGRADRLAGSIRAGAIGSTITASYNARFDAHAMHLEIAFDRAPIVAYYRLFGDRIPETRVAHIAGTASFALRLALPDGALVVKPAIEGFAVAGLGTELLAGRMPRVRCGDEAIRGAARVRLDGRPAGSGPWLARAVVAAEDQRYAEHPGYDLVELAASLSRNAKEVARDADASTRPRGASTIPQQLARVLYVGSDRSTSRKLRELLYAVEMERTLGKARMLHLYLAVAPWGEGVCGADAAARRYFGVDAARLDGAQAVWLAAMLHAPDTEFERWQARGGIDAARARFVVDGMRGTTKGTRRKLLDGLDALALPARSITTDRSVATVVASGAAP